MKKFILFIAFILIGKIGFAQQYPLFTNYIMNEYGFNPALAGQNPYIDTRLTYRTQWVGIEDAPKTQIITANSPLKGGPIGLGGTLYNDVAGQMKRTGFSVGGSYGIKVGGDSTNVSMLRIGLTGGMYSFQLSDDLLAKDIDDETLMAGMERTWHPDLNIGVHLDLNNGVFVGVSTPQLLKRSIDLIGDGNGETTDLVPHIFGVVGYNFRLNETVTLQPSALIKYVNTAPVQVDFNMKAQFQEKYWAGLAYRSGDAVSAMLGIDLTQSLMAAYAYDFTLSDLNEGSKGSHEITLGLRLGMKKDRDKDTVLDKDDPCPDVWGPVENQGCPEEEEEEEEDEEDDPEGDKDEDGVLNKDDLCPEVKGLKTNNGCPLGDRDNDGLRDDLDLCPDVPGLAVNNGCPLSDRDKDGIIDEKDVCPDEPGPLRLEGCPESKADADGDGIPDKYDNCPNSRGNGPNGCPVATAEEKAILDLAIRNLYFDTDKDKIKNRSFQYLDKLAEVMVLHPDWRIRMTGHTDDRGSDEYNLDLSKRRVEAAMFYLINRGMGRQQLITEYYGERQPAASNVSESTMKLNRRVEMEFVFN